MLYIANLYKTMKLITMEGRNTVTFSAPWSPDGQAPPSLQSVMVTLPKGKNMDFKGEVEKLQEAMT